MNKVNLNQILTKGGDSRIFINPKTGLNKYGSSFVFEKNLVTFSSTTSTSISKESHEYISKILNKYYSLNKKSKFLFLNSLYKKCQKEIKKILSLQNTKIYLTSSGTEALSTNIQLISEKYNDVSVILCSADETASGALNAVSGKYFDGYTMFHKKVKKGKIINKKIANVIEIKNKNNFGNYIKEKHLKNKIDKLIAVEKKLLRHVILVAADQSKLGIISPLPNTIDFLKKKYGKDLTVIIDACQLRLSPDRLSKMINKDYFINISGSKFFTGIPFSGAILTSMKLSKRYQFHICENIIPNDFNKISNNEKLRAYLGIILRWLSAINEANKIKNELFEKNFYKKLKFLSDIFYKKLNQYSFIDPLFKKKDFNYDYSKIFKNDISSARTIFPFFVLDKKKNKMKYEKLCELYEFLNSNNADSKTSQNYELFSDKCLIGQPVSGFKENVGVLRVSIGLRMFLFNNKDDKFIKKQINNLDLVFRKINLFRST